ncbi:unnamed protein product [Symbiodinium natans]|uniref:Endonuclease/exonuclease/phosphatase domain-containing protein n=1 Tax=Symbiodinium natans TaxID=878477 RepID=A0A812P3D3_9DINO|nr:unnamed protein product [Symbiodinium natans]
MEPSAPSSLLRALTTWNTWGVPFASPLLFHRFGKWRAFHDQQLLKFLGEDRGDRDLLVCCFQEVWSFPRGPLMECTARMDPDRVTAKWERFVLILGILCRLFSCCTWDAAQKLFEKREPNASRIEYAVVVGNKGKSLAWNSLVDSGLCILATQAPADTGFRAYRNYPDGLHEERLANKGMLWAFWGPSRTSHQSSQSSQSSQQGLLVLNTHLSTRGAVKRRQLQELGSLTAELRSRLLTSVAVLEVYLCGDFNLDPKWDTDFEAWYKELGFQRITTGKPTNAGQNTALDHIFAWRSDDQSVPHLVSEPVRPWVQKGRFTTCACERDDISDHCWQGMAVPRQPK